VHYEASPDTDVKPKVVVAEVTAWLAKLPMTGSHKQLFQSGGYDIEIEAMMDDEKPSSGCVRAIFSPVISIPDYSKRIASVLNGKRKKFSSKITGLPLVIMVGSAADGFNVDSHALDKALFGHHVLVWGTASTAPAEFQRDRTGYFTPSYAHGRVIGKNTGISAVLYCSTRNSETEYSVCFQMQVFHNPEAHILLDEDVFQKMPQLVKTNIDPLGYSMRWVITNPESTAISFIIAE
jgi:hypothetical protein